jgi:hypothetical protein
MPRLAAKGEGPGFKHEPEGRSVILKGRGKVFNSLEIFLI